MNNCKFFPQCGGCLLRNLEDKEYQDKKISDFRKTIAFLKQEDICFGEEIFIPDGQRRRASFTFLLNRGALSLGFNQAKSNDIISLDKCNLLTPRINKNLAVIEAFVKEICQVKVTKKVKAKKFTTSNIFKGDILVCDAYNGLDIVLECDSELSYDHRCIIVEFVQGNDDVVRVSHRKNATDSAEAIVEKTKPVIKVADYDILIPAGTFLQPSEQGQSALVNLVLKYIGESKGKIADLFCGVGTFSYPLARTIENKITAIDSSKLLLQGFTASVNKNMIPNINVQEKNLFKYPLDEKELKDFTTIVIDPPRAGCSAQIEKIANADSVSKVVYVSCNPKSFVKDANILIDAGFKIAEITFVDQFIYSNHSELVALFEK